MTTQNNDLFSFFQGDHLLISSENTKEIKVFNLRKIRKDLKVLFFSSRVLINGSYHHFFDNNLVSELKSFTFKQITGEDPKTEKDTTLENLRNISTEYFDIIAPTIELGKKNPKLMLLSDFLPVIWEKVEPQKTIPITNLD